MGRIAALFSEQKITLPLQRKQQMLALDREFEELESKVDALEAENLKLRAQINPLKQKIERLEKEIENNASAIQASNPDGYVCDHCGSPKLKRTGSRLNDTFGIMGTKDAIFVCHECGKESAFIIE